ncbi:MAG: SpoIIE family protein phosphatase [Planctomycetes bacterium]|nr:SpoIIE family protein phosphatase [Planctomycetota bacterium]
MRVSVRTKLVLAIGLPMLLAYGVMIVFQHGRERANAIKDMEQYLTQLTRNEASRLDSRFMQVAQVVRTTGDILADSLQRPKSAGQQAFDPARLENVLRTNVRQNERVFGMCVAFEPGVFESAYRFFAPYVCRGETGGRIKTMYLDYDYTRWDWYLLPKHLDQPAWTDPYFDEGGGNILMCTYGVPIKFPDGKFAGVITADISLGNLCNRISQIGIPGGYCMILSGSGTVVAHPKREYIMAESIFSLAERYESRELFELGRQITAGRTGVSRIPDFETGKPRFYVYAPIESTGGWSLVAAMPEDKVLEPVYQNLKRNMAVLCAGLFVIILIVLFVSHRITVPIKRLAAVTAKMADGDLDVQVTGIKGSDEIAQFGRTFNRMVSDLKASIEARISETAAREAVEKELQVAREIQRSLLPRVFPPFPDRTEFDLHAEIMPAKCMAGDFFDFFFMDRNRDELALVMADVSGKGVPAAMFMAVTRTAIRNFTVESKTPAQILQHANDVIVQDNDEGMFVTIFYAHYHVKTGELVYANAGHCQPFLIGLAGDVAMLEVTGPILGVLPGSQFEDRTCRIAKGQTLLFYTDGVTEARGNDSELFGEEGLQKLLAGFAGDPKALCQKIVQVADDYRNHDPQDDITVMALRRNI